MKTSDLIAALAETSVAAPRRVVARGLALAVAAGAAAAFALLVAWLGMRPMGEAAADPMFWIKGVYTVALALAGAFLLARLARPGGRGGWAAVAVAVVVAAMAVLGLMQLMHTEPQARMGVLMGSSSRMCPWRILAMAAPVYAGLVLALRGLAPTRPALAGAAAGLLAGAVGATVYELFCTETAAAFVAVWYTLGIGLAGAIGGVIGWRALRW